jgi:hypothetical protein
MNDRDLFIGALQRPDPAERQAYLAEACGGDVALRQRVEGLLEVHERAGSFLERPVVEAGGRGEYTPGGAEGPAEANPAAGRKEAV